MKILLYTLIFPPDTCSNAFIFSDMTTEFLKSGDEVTVITTTPHYDEEHAEGKKKYLEKGKSKWYRKSNYMGAFVYHIDVVPRKGNIKDRLDTFYRFHHYCTKLLTIEKIEADVVICQTPPMTIGIDCHRIAKRLHASSVMILQDLWLDAMIDAGRIKGIMAYLLRQIEIYEYKKMDLLTTIDEAMGKRIKDISGIQPFVIPNFVDCSIYSPRVPNADDYDKYNIDRENFVISYVGNIGEAQDLEPLIQYAKHNKKARIIIAGNGSREGYYKKRVRDEDLDSVSFIGYISRDEARIVNSVSDVCMIMLAKHVAATSFPSKIYSLMAMGKPIVISCAENNEAGQFVEQHEIGWRCDVGNYERINALLDLVGANEKQRRIRGENGRSLVLREYSPGKIVKRYKDIISEMRDHPCIK